MEKRMPALYLPRAARMILSEDDDEQFVETHLRTLDLRPERYSKRERVVKTPDFKVMRDGQVRFFCEVKRIFGDWKTNGIWEERSGENRIYNSIATHIGKAVEQFDAVNAGLLVPNVLAFVNHDRLCGALDLFSVVTRRAVDGDGKSLSPSGSSRKDPSRTRYVESIYSFGGMKLK